MKKYTLGWLFVGALLAAEATWAETDSTATSPEQQAAAPVAPVEPQDQDKSEDETWTWFGMGFEDRHRLLDDGADGFGPGRRPAGGFSSSPIRDSGRK